MLGIVAGCCCFSSIEPEHYKLVEMARKHHMQLTLGCEGVDYTRYVILGSGVSDKAVEGVPEEIEKKEGS